jgi:DNA-binding HxlR family transcriptional regulator
MEDRPFNVFAKGCPSRTAFEAIFSRWGILVLGYLSNQPTRFGTLRDAIDGISEKMLAQTLKVLEEEGFIQRRDWDEKPPRVEYSLTEAGRKMSEGVHVFIADFYEALKARKEIR